MPAALFGSTLRSRGLSDRGGGDAVVFLGCHPESATLLVAPKDLLLALPRSHQPFARSTSPGFCSRGLPGRGGGTLWPLCLCPCAFCRAGIYARRVFVFRLSPSSSAHSFTPVNDLSSEATQSVAEGSAVAAFEPRAPGAFALALGLDIQQLFHQVIQTIAVPSHPERIVQPLVQLVQLGIHRLRLRVGHVL